MGWLWLRRSFLKKEGAVFRTGLHEIHCSYKALAATTIDVKEIVAEPGLESGTPLFFQQTASKAVCRFFPSRCESGQNFRDHRSWSPSASGNCGHLDWLRCSEAASCEGQLGVCSRQDSPDKARERREEFCRSQVTMKPAWPMRSGVYDD